LIVTATTGIVLSPALRTTTFITDDSASFWSVGKVTFWTSTGNLPEGSSASCRSPLPPHPKNSTDAVAALTNAQARPALLRWTPKPRVTYHGTRLTRRTTEPKGLSDGCRLPPV